MSQDTNDIALPLPPQIATEPPDEGRLVRRVVRVLVTIGAAVLLLIAIRLWESHTAEERLVTLARHDAAAHVAVIHPKATQASEELVLPANVQAFVEAPIYARTQGYLKRWYFDIGAHVHRGDLLAEIETPEGDLQLDQARADLKAMQANAALAASTAARWQALLKKNAVSKQETDQALSDLSAKRAAADAALANVRRLTQLQDFERVYAPFDGVITARQTDVGALIDPNSSPKELFHLASVDKLRVFAAVPETSAAAIKLGETVTLTSDQYPNRIFRGTITRDAGAIDPTTRTLNVEVDIDNASGDLLPGSYGFLHIPLPGQAAPLTIPANALIFRAQGMQVAVVRKGHAVLVPITIGHDFGDSVEVVSGVTANDRVILDPSDSIVDGDPVEVEGSN